MVIFPTFTALHHIPYPLPAPPFSLLCMSLQVSQTDIDEALRLMRMSKASLLSDLEPQRKEDNVSVCYK